MLGQWLRSVHMRPALLCADHAAHLAVISERRVQPSCLAPFGKLVAQRPGTGEGRAVIVGEEIQDTSGPLHGVERPEIT